jgi:hypothetical protein
VRCAVGACIIWNNILYERINSEFCIRLILTPCL